MHIVLKDNCEKYIYRNIVNVLVGGNLQQWDNFHLFYENFFPFN